MFSRGNDIIFETIVCLIKKGGISEQGIPPFIMAIKNKDVRVREI